MVKELFVEEPEKEISWDDETRYLFEFAVDGVALPDDYEAELRKRSFFCESDRDPAAVHAERKWDEYHVALGIVDFSTDPRTPRERLNEFFNKG